VKTLSTRNPPGTAFGLGATLRQVVALDPRGYRSMTR
jgi:hypothetical protein